MGSRSAGMDDSFRDALMIEVRDLLSQVMILEEGWSPRSCLEGMVRVIEPGALSRGQPAALLGLIFLRVVAGCPGRRRGTRSALVLLRRQRFTRCRRFFEVRSAGAGFAGNGWTFV